MEGGREGGREGGVKGETWREGGREGGVKGETEGEMEERREGVVSSASTDLGSHVHEQSGSHGSHGLAVPGLGVIQGIGLEHSSEILLTEEGREGREGTREEGREGNEKGEDKRVMYMYMCVHVTHNLNSLQGHTRLATGTQGFLRPPHPLLRRNGRSMYCSACAHSWQSGSGRG